MTQKFTRRQLLAMTSSLGAAIGNAVIIQNFDLRECGRVDARPEHRWCDREAPQRVVVAERRGVFGGCRSTKREASCRTTDVARKSARTERAEADRGI